MRRHRPPGFHGNNLPGPGDFRPPDPEELDEMYLDDARAKLAQNVLDGFIDADAITEDAVTELAWKLQHAARKQAELDAGEDAYERQKDREAGLE